MILNPAQPRLLRDRHFRFAAALHELSSGGVIFRNLDVIAAADL
jgi:hypothetical protein